MARDVIPLYRVKPLAFSERAVQRLLPVEKSPSKARELRAERPHARMGGRERDALDGLSKIQHRARKSMKLRFFRVFKLLGPEKQLDPSAAPLRDDGGRRVRWMKRF
jgi:hypothetical protein